MTENEIASIAVDAIYAVYKGLGLGLLESVYQKVLLYELKKRDLDTVPEVKIHSATMARTSVPTSVLTLLSRTKSS